MTLAFEQGPLKLALRRELVRHLLQCEQLVGLPQNHQRGAVHRENEVDVRTQQQRFFRLLHSAVHVAGVEVDFRQQYSRRHHIGVCLQRILEVYVGFCVLPLGIGLHALLVVGALRLREHRGAAHKRQQQETTDNSVQRFEPPGKCNRALGDRAW